MAKSKVVLATILLAVILTTCLSACFERVVPCAWVALDADGYVVYTSNMYASGGEHIYLYDNERDAQNDTAHARCAMSITFYPRIMGVDTVDGYETTIVDISQKASMVAYIYKQHGIYSADKSFYINGIKLKSSSSIEYDIVVCYTFDNLPLERGNPGGKENGKINRIEYR